MKIRKATDSNNVFEEFDMAGYVTWQSCLPGTRGNATGVTIADDNFIKPPYPKMAPALTDKEGIFVAGIASGPKDIVDSILEAGSAAMDTANYIRSMEATGKTAA